MISMKCYHIIPKGADLSKIRLEYHCLPVGENLFMVHENCAECPQPQTCIGHVLDDDNPVTDAVANALSAHGVVSNDTPKRAILKVAKTWKVALP